MKLNFILDLDQTIISSEELTGKSKSKDKVIFNFNVNDEKKSISENEMGQYHKLDQYIIVERPYLQEFLDYIFENFNVSVWTAASKEYARFICQKIILNKPERKLDYFLYVEHCHMSTPKDIKNIKNLDFLYSKDREHFNPYNTILLDDSKDHVNYSVNNSKNIIRAKEFFFLKNNKDDFLLKLTEQLENSKRMNARKVVSKINNYFKN